MHSASQPVAESEALVLAARRTAGHSWMEHSAGPLDQADWNEPLIRLNIAAVV